VLVSNPLKVVEETTEAMPAEAPGATGTVVRHRYEMDFDDLAKKAADPNNTLLLLCNPHNPVGRAWSAADLRRLLDICVQNGVVVVSDEIHGDLVLPGFTHTSIMQVADVGEYSSVMVCTAPSKTFNLAGCQSSVAFVPHESMRDALREELGRSAIWQLNALAYPATIAAYTECDAWLEELLEVISGNYAFLRGFMERYLPEIEVYQLEATYLAWLDFRAWGLTPQELEDFMTKDALLFFDEGYVFGEEGNGFERINLACPRSVIEESLERLVAAARERKLGTFGGVA
ncbi:MAG: aminotransferase class I/II-fold pyridoxal phosphate-dependent enzyme, partial [Olsenella sp.]|nr:aminotransferase class I/II-fold pyridoxal phosphate-dependent enzyme [Olsenella sp.]